MIRPFTSLAAVVCFALASSACGDEKTNTTTVTTNPTSNPSSNPSGDEDSETATAADTTTPTSDTGVSVSEGTDTTAEPTTDPATGPGTTPDSETLPGTDTGTNPGTDTGTNPGTDTGETTLPGTDTGDTGGGAAEAPYNACASDADCDDGSLCINSAITGDQVKGSFCSPTCDGDVCPDPADGVNASQGGVCLFGADPMTPTNCAPVCIVGDDDCGPDSDCEDIGIPAQMGKTPGVCTHPA